MLMDLISAESLNYSFITNKKTLNNINYAINVGEKNVIIGANGSGKTTFLRCILGMLKTVKKIKIENHYVEDLSKCTKLSTNIKDALHLSGDLSINEFLKYHMELKNQDPQKALKLLDYFHLNDILRKKVTKLSSGQEKLIYDIAALAPESFITILDEPLNSVDPVRARLLIDLINARNQSFIITLHDLNVIKILQNATLNIMVDGTLSGKLIPADKIFSLHAMKEMPENYIMQILANNENIYLSEDEKSDGGHIEKLEDLLYL